MKIKKITSQYRRDFTAIIECEFCNHTENTSGYDDSYYHKNVMPNKPCTICDKSTNSEKGEIQSFTTRYPEGFQV